VEEGRYMFSFTDTDRHRRALKWALLISLAPIPGCLLAAYHVSRKELPLFFQIDTPLTSGFFLCLSVILILSGIRCLIPPFAASISKRFGHEMWILGCAFLSIGIALLSLWLNREFEIYPALRVSFLAFVAASILFAIQAMRLAALLRAGRK
jgi:hypothetical protein